MAAARSIAEKLTAQQLERLLRDLHKLRAEVAKTRKKLMAEWKPLLKVRGANPSLANMAAYIGLRRHDLSNIQSHLAAMGLSSLGRTEGHVLANLDAVIHALEALNGKPTPVKKFLSAVRTFNKDSNLLARNTKELLGKPPAHRKVRIMVTLPSIAAQDDDFVKQLVTRGMDCARINCAHDSPDIWQRMSESVRRAAKETGRDCKVMMDLAGPKLRTGPIATAQGVVRLKPLRDRRGSVTEPEMLILDSSGKPGCGAGNDVLGRKLPARLSVDSGWLKRLSKGDNIRFVDLRGKEGILIVDDTLTEHEVRVLCDKSAYLEEGLQLRHLASSVHHPVFETFIGSVAPSPVTILLKVGDQLLLTRTQSPGEPAIRAKDRSISPAHIACATPAILDQLQPGQRVEIDDGKIGAKVLSLEKEGILLQITRAKAQGSKLMAEKGLNFPDCDLQLPALTEKDMNDLNAAVCHADIVGYSFVQSSDDMEQLIKALKKLNGSKHGIVAKIETRMGLKNLPEIIVRGMGDHPFGVMIARGDLAIEIGYEQLAETQEEIMWLCEASHVPVIWATQVLEGLVKQNLPSRAEVTDAAMAERAECIMLNKGPFVLDAIDVLDHVVGRMQSHQRKKRSVMRTLRW